MIMGRVVAGLIGVVVLGWGVALLLDIRGATDWWIDYATRQRSMFGRGWGPRYDRESTRWLGACTALVGVLIVAIAVLD